MISIQLYGLKYWVMKLSFLPFLLIGWTILRCCFQIRVPVDVSVYDNPLKHINGLCKMIREMVCLFYVRNQTKKNIIILVLKNSLVESGCVALASIIEVAGGFGKVFSWFFNNFFLNAGEIFQVILVEKKNTCIKNYYNLVPIYGFFWDQP